MKNSIILLASHNKGKVAEMQSPFTQLGYQIENLDFLAEPIEEVEETGITFEENALLKARFVSQKTGYIALADDSGLEVYSLNNAPGVYSARYAQRRDDIIHLPQHIHETKDMLNILQVLKDMQGIEEDNRKARFCSCLALVFPTGEEYIAHGYWEGIITQEIIGSNGFGYDPIFYDPILKKTSAQLTKIEKMSVSHRARAIENLLAKIKDIPNTI